MEKHGNVAESITRRGFLKTTAITGAAASLPVLSSTLVGCSGSGKSEAVASDEEHKLVGCLGGCGGRCILDMSMRDGKLVSVKNKELINDRARENVCQRGLSHPVTMYSGKRVLYPMRRVGERGESRFERISWDDAIEEICTKWQGYAAQYGPQSIALFGGSAQSDDSGSAFSFSGYPCRAAAYMNMTKVECNFDNAAIQMIFKITGFGLSTGGNDWADVVNAKHIICWASNPIEGKINAYRHVTTAQRNGASLTVIDPNFTVSATKADKYIPIRPASDGLLGFALMRKVLDAGLEDREYLKAMTVAPFLVNDATGRYLTASELGLAEAGSAEDLPLALEEDGTPIAAISAQNPQLNYIGEVQGIAVHTAYDLLLERIRTFEYTNEEIFELTGVSEADADEIVAQLVDGPVTLIMALGADHYTNGHTFYTCILTLLMLTGNIGKHGAGIIGPGVSNFTSMAGSSLTGMLFPMEPGVGVSAVVDGAYFRNVIRTGKLGEADWPIKSILAPGANFLANQAGRREWIDELLPKIDYLVVMDIFFNDTSAYADIILVCYWFEAERYWTSEGYTLHSEQIAEPLGESKGDLEILNLLMEGMGHPEGVLTRDEFMTTALDNDLCKSFGVTWETVKQQKLIKTVPDGYTDYLGSLGIGNTEGRFSFFYNGAAPADPFCTEWDYERERLPYWEPPTEAWPTTEAAKKFPLQFITKRSRFKAHTFYTFSENLLELMPEPYVTMNPADAEVRGLKDGEYVHVFNDHGDMVTLLYVNPGIRPGIVQIDHGWSLGQFKSGHYSDLTSGVASPVVGNNCWFDCMCDVEKA